MGLLAIIGLCVLCGGLGAWVFQKLHIFQAVGCTRYVCLSYSR